MVTFRQLAARLTEEEVEENIEDEDAVSGCREPSDARLQRLVIADLFPSIIRPDDFLGRMLRAPGFVPAFAERLREWKLAGLTPDLLEQSGLLIVCFPVRPDVYARKTAGVSAIVSRL